MVVDFAANLLLRESFRRTWKAEVPAHSTLSFAMLLRCSQLWRKSKTSAAGESYGTGART